MAVDGADDARPRPRRSGSTSPCPRPTSTPGGHGRRSGRPGSTRPPRPPGSSSPSAGATTSTSPSSSRPTSETKLTRLAGATVPQLLAAGAEEGRPPTPPAWGTSLLTELARHSLLASSAAVARRTVGGARAVVEPVEVDRGTPTQTETWALRLRPTDLTRRGDPTVGVRANVVNGLKTLATKNAADVDRALRAALETATNRLDPWATAIAWRRLQSLAAAPRTLGAYGWVDAPRPQTPGDHRFVLAPSTEQAATAAVLRDRALHDADADRWQMTLASDPIRGALQLADATREGAHPTESLGQKVEAIVNRPDVIDRLRDAFPSLPFFVLGFMRIRRVCDGAAVLDAAVNRPGELTGLGVRPAQLKALQELAAAVDALADLHVAEAVLGVVKGRTATAAAATAAAGGQAPPPDFDVVRTPRSGRTVTTVALVVLPNAPTPGGVQPSPVALADPAVAAYVDARAGAAASASWTWKKLDPEGSPAGAATLADVGGLRPCDTVGLGIDQLRELVREASGAAALDPEDPPGPAIVRSLAAALAGAPALTEDVDAPPSPAAATELVQRYTRVRNAAASAATDARAAGRTCRDRERTTQGARPDGTVGDHPARRGEHARRASRSRSRGARAPHRRSTRDTRRRDRSR